MFNYRTAVPAKPAVNSRSEHLTWEDALAYVHDLTNYHILSVKGYWARDLENPKYLLDLDHLWDVQKAKEKAFDFLMGHLGLADFFEIEH